MTDSVAFLLDGDDHGLNVEVPVTRSSAASDLASGFSFAFAADYDLSDALLDTTDDAILFDAVPSDLLCTAADVGVHGCEMVPCEPSAWRLRDGMRAVLQRQVPAEVLADDDEHVTDAAWIESQQSHAHIGLLHVRAGDVAQCSGYTMLAAADTPIQNLPAAWVLEYTQDCESWYPADIVDRSQVAADANDEETPAWGRVCACGGTRSITRTLSSPLVCRGIRVNVQRIGGSTGSMSGATRDGASLRLHRVRFQSHTHTQWAHAQWPFAWRLSLFGPPGQPHLRLTHASHAVDVVSAAHVGWCLGQSCRIRVIATGTHTHTGAHTLTGEHTGAHIHTGRDAAGESTADATNISMPEDAVAWYRLSVRVLVNGDVMDLRSLHESSIRGPLMLPCVPASLISCSRWRCSVGGPPRRTAEASSLQIAAVDDARSYAAVATTRITNLVMEAALDSTSFSAAPGSLESLNVTETLDRHRRRCLPLRSLEQLLLWQPNGDIDEALRVSPVDASASTNASVLGCVARWGVSSRGASIVCHDCGPSVYVQDTGTEVDRHVECDRAQPEPLLPPSRCVQPPRCIGHGYSFDHWQRVDALIYFSHHRISIPPLAWIQQAHMYGKRVLGTIIAEWRDGQAASALLLGAHSDAIAAKLADVARYYGFHGWLLNFESPVLQSDCAERVMSFVSALTERVHARVPDGVVLWYDALVPETGRIRWQSALNDVTGPLLRVCDGVFLDYHWAPSSLAHSVEWAYAHELSARLPDVLVGIDVWGRGTHGGGQHSSPVAVCAIEDAAAARDCFLGVALFAPAWTYESGDGRRSVASFQQADAELWYGPPASPVSEPCVVEAASDSGPGAHGWRIVEAGGDGWAQEELAAEQSPTGRPVVSFTASYEACVMERTHRLTPHSGAWHLHISDWVRGTGPNVHDPYRWQLELLDGASHVLPGYSFDTGWRAARSERWTCLEHTWHTVPVEAVTCVVRRAGRDAEHWKGTYGSAWCGGAVEWRRDSVTLAERSGGLAVCRSFAMHTSAIRSLPFLTNFSDGRGVISSTPSFDLLGRTCLPDAGGVVHVACEPDDDKNTLACSSRLVHGAGWTSPAAPSLPLLPRLPELSSCWMVEVVGVLNAAVTALVPLFSVDRALLRCRPSLVASVAWQFETVPCSCAAGISFDAAVEPVLCTRDTVLSRGTAPASGGLITRPAGWHATERSMTHNIDEATERVFLGVECRAAMRVSDSTAVSAPVAVAQMPRLRFFLGGLAISVGDAW